VNPADIQASLVKNPKEASLKELMGGERTVTVSTHLTEIQIMRDKNY